MSFVVRLAQVGDEVVMKMDQEARDWGRKGVPNGTKGVVIGKNRFQRYYARVGIDAYSKPKPGIYEADCTLQVRWEDGTESAESWDVELADKKLNDQRHKELWSIPVFSKTGNYDSDLAHAQEAKLLNDVYIGELPDYPCWEGDLVFAEWNGEEQHLLIERIEYNWVKEDGDAVYNVRFSDASGVDQMGGSSYLNQSKVLKIVKRGNLWKMHHGEPLTFSDLAEEVSFFRSLHHYKELRNPANQLFSWTAKEALEAIRNGDADGFGMSGSFLGTTSKPQPFRMTDRELGERVRSATIKGFEGCIDPDEGRN